MPDDKRPNPRFAMIALEMSGEIEPPPSPPSTAPQLLVDGDGSIRCPRCTFKAFVPMADREVVCVGCPDNRRYAMPDGSYLGSTPLYRCDACGVRRRVTMTLSVVNLHCINCKRLIPHTKQIDANEVRRERYALERSARQVRTPPPWNFKSSLGWLESNKDFKPFTPSEIFTAANEVRRERYVRDLSSRVRSEARESTRALERVVTERMRVALGLADFDVFAKTRREMNAAAVIRGEYAGNDIARRTGRTTCGLLKMIAKCSLERWIRIWVRGSSGRRDKELLSNAAEMIRALKLDYPREVGIMTFRIQRTFIEGEYFDHTYYEQRAQSLSANGDDIDLERGPR